MYRHSEEDASIEMTVTEEAAQWGLERVLRHSESGGAEVYFCSLPPQYRYFLDDKIVSTAVESKEDVAKLVSQFFVLAVFFSSAALIVPEVNDDIATDAPKAYQFLAMMVKCANLASIVIYIICPK